MANLVCSELAYFSGNLILGIFGIVTGITIINGDRDFSVRALAEKVNELVSVDGIRVAERALPVLIRVRVDYILNVVFIDFV